MYCVKCGNRVEQHDRFCSACGQPVQALQALQALQEEVGATSESAYPAIPEVATEPLEPASKPKASPKKLGTWWMPIAAAVLVGMGLGGDVLYERHVNSQVESMRVQGETLALQGKFDDAKSLFQKALNQRPQHQTLAADLGFADLGVTVSKQFSQAQDNSKQGKFDQALSALDQADAKIKDGQGPIFDLLKKQLTSQRSSVTVAQIKFQLKDKKTVDELAGLLTKVDAIHTIDGKQVAGDIRKQIADVAYTQANDLLQKKQFADASSCIDRALTYDSGDNKLLSFKDTITKQQQAFEQEEQQRIQQAIVSQAKEDEKNRTQSVQVVSIKGAPDAQGDFVVQGQVKNVGSRPISMVAVYYSVLDATGVEVRSGYTYVYPNYIAPGETGNFEDTLFFVQNGVKVKFTNATWYLQ